MLAFSTMKNAHGVVSARLRGGHEVAPAVIDTGTSVTVVPRRLAQGAGLARRGEAGALRMLGRVWPGRFTRATIEFADQPRCHAETEVFVPNSRKANTFLLGMEFLQAVGARINVRSGEEKLVRLPRGSVVKMYAMPEERVFRARKHTDRR
jgi:predicted aspartyl protease